MIEHVSIPVSDIKKAREFYVAALAPLSYHEEYNWGSAIGFMEDGHTSFIIQEEETVVPTHIAFRAKSKEVVEEFYTAALAAGGTDNGAPGYRDYSPGYYAAFVLDMDGNNVEAVHFEI